MSFILILFLAMPPTLLENDAISMIKSGDVIYEQYMAKHFECHGSKEMTHTPLCDALNEMPAAREQTAIYLDAYCGVKDYLNNFRQPCEHDATVKDKLSARISRLNAIMARVHKAK